MALTPKPAEVDFGLFIRPFRNEAWVCIFALCLIILITILIPYGLVDDYEETEAFTCVTVSAWIFFVVINAYYGGAMTMFFTSEFSVQFNSIEDVMRDDDWNLKACPCPFIQILSVFYPDSIQILSRLYPDFI